jgi:release factor glutamine methyltransferase
MKGHTVGELLTAAVRAIDKRDAQYMLCHFTGINRAGLIANPDRLLDVELVARFREAVAARADGKPVAQIVGEREFFGRRFMINEHVLIPRPETEILTEQALVRLSSHKWPKVPADRSLSVLDMGTGSGAIAVTLALELPTLTVTAIDASAAALRLARANANHLGATVRFVESDWYQALAGEAFDMIVTNPPYIAAHDPHLSLGDLRFEPTIALTDHSTDGLDAIRSIVAGAHAHLHRGGWLLIEHGYDQAARVATLLLDSGFIEVDTTPDLAGIPRVTMGRVAL